jgi:hypothetical protein
MTEEQWIACPDPTPLLNCLNGEASDRKLRLFACACFRQIWELIEVDEYHNLVEIAERFADGLASAADLSVAHGEAIEWCNEGLPCGDDDAFAGAVETVQSAWRFVQAHLQHNYHELNRAQQRAAKHARQIERTRQDNPASDRAYAKALQLATETSVAAAEAKAKLTEEGLQEERNKLFAAQADLLRCVFGLLPFRSISVDAPSLSSIVTTMAHAIYNERAFDRLPILADALEEAGCTSPEILAHCRGPGPHVRGCRVVDLVLGKE